MTTQPFQNFTLPVDGLGAISTNAPGSKWPDGAHRVRIGNTVEFKPTKRALANDPTRSVDMTMKFTITDEEGNGLSKDIYLSLPQILTSQGQKKGEHDAGFIKDIVRWLAVFNNVPVDQLTAGGQLEVREDLLVGKTGYVFVRNEDPKPGERYGNDDFRAVNEQEYQRKHWRKVAESAPQSQGLGHTTAAAPVAAPTLAAAPTAPAAGFGTPAAAPAGVGAVQGGPAQAAGVAPTAPAPAAPAPAAAGAPLSSFMPGGA